MTVQLAAIIGAEVTATVRSDAGDLLSRLTKLAALVDRGARHVEIAETFPLDKGREAFESGERRNRRAGKTVIIVQD